MPNLAAGYLPSTGGTYLKDRYPGIGEVQGERGVKWHKGCKRSKEC